MDDKIITELSKDIDNIYINNDESDIFYTINNNIILKSNYNHNSNIINKIESLIIHDFMDNPEPKCFISNTLITLNDSYSNLNDFNNNTNGTNDTNDTNDTKISVPTNFFECFDENLSINNAIVCDKLDPNASYMFETEDLRKNDIYPFEDGVYNLNKKKSTRSRVSIIALSAVKLLGGSWLENLL